MRSAAILLHHARVRADTAPVTRPRTGFPFLDDGLDQPGAVLAFAHRGGAFHPEVEGLENTPGRLHRTRSHSATDTSRPTCTPPATACSSPSTTSSSTGSPSSVGRLSDLSYDDVRSARVGGREQIPTLASLLEEFPDARFNIDLKSDGAVDPLVDLIRPHRRARPGLCRVVLRPPDPRVPATDGPRGRHRVRCGRRRRHQARTHARACGHAAWNRPRVPGAAPPRLVPRRHRGARATGPTAWAGPCTCGRWTTADEMHSLLDLGCRRADDGPHRRAARRAPRTRTWMGGAS